MIIKTEVRTSLIILVAAAFILSCAVLGFAQAGPTARAVAEHMDKGKYSSAEIKGYLKDLRGQTVTADGKVHDILSGKTGNKVVLHVDTPKSKDFVVDVYIDDASKIRKGNHVSCKGEYARYNMFNLNGITLKNGTCK